MTIKERVRMLRIIDKANRNKTFSKRIGINTELVHRKEREQKNEVHRCRF